VKYSAGVRREGMEPSGLMSMDACPPRADLAMGSRHATPAIESHSSGPAPA
jgi:hypothetical protein